MPSRVRALFTFPDPVDEHAARVVAAGVVVMAVATIVFRQPWLLAVLCYGFVARVLAGPTLSPLGLLATRVVVPRSGWTPKQVPGPPKRFAQGIGVVFSAIAVVLHFGFGATDAAYAFIALLACAAALEAFAGVCLGCRAFALLMRAGVIPESVCVACADLSRAR